MMQVTQTDLIIEVEEALVQCGGRALKRTIEKIIYEKFSAAFSQPYYQEEVANGVHRWRHNIAWAKERAKKQRIVKWPAQSGRGWWELTETAKKRHGIGNGVSGNHEVPDARRDIINQDSNELEPHELVEALIDVKASAIKKTMRRECSISSCEPSRVLLSDAGRREKAISCGGLNSAAFDDLMIMIIDLAGERIQESENLD